MLIEQVRLTYRDSTLFERALAIALESVPDELRALEEEGTGISANIIKSEGVLDRYFTAFEEGRLDTKSLSSRIEKHAIRLEELRVGARRVAEEIAKLDSSNTGLVDLSRVLSQTTNILSSSENFREKKRCLSGLVDSITIQPGGVVESVLRVPVLDGTLPKQSDHQKEVARNGSPRASRHRSPKSTPPVLAAATPVRTGSPIVEVRGFEPRTPCMPCKCSTS
jgi:hypothetical protein